MATRGKSGAGDKLHQLCCIRFSTHTWSHEYTRQQLLGLGLWASKWGKQTEQKISLAGKTNSPSWLACDFQQWHARNVCIAQQTFEALPDLTPFCSRLVLWEYAGIITILKTFSWGKNEIWGLRKVGAGRQLVLCPSAPSYNRPDITLHIWSGCRQKKMNRIAVPGPAVQL